MQSNIVFALLIGEWLLSSELMISVLLRSLLLFPVNLLVVFSSLSFKGRLSSDRIFLSLVLCQRTRTNCASMDKDWSKSAVLGIYWTE